MAQQMVDEVGLLEAALRDAVEKKRGLTPHASPSKELHGQVLTEHFKVSTEAAVSPNAQVRDRFENSVAAYGRQLKAWVDMQVDGRLNLVLRGLIEETALETAELQQETLASVENLMLTVEELKRSVAMESREGKFALYDKLLDEMRSMHVQHDASFAELKNALQHHEQRLQTWRAEITATVNEEFRTLNATWGDEAPQRQEIGEMNGCFDNVARHSDLTALQRVLEASQARLGEDLVALQQRLISELRAETTAAFKNEAAGVKALDEQLWRSDQQLGQRIDKLAHLHQKCITSIADLAHREREFSHSPERRDFRVDEGIRITDRDIGGHGLLLRRGGCGTTREEVHIEEEFRINDGGARGLRTLRGASANARDDVHVEDDIRVSERNAASRSHGTFRGAGIHRNEVHIDEDIHIGEKEMAGRGLRGLSRGCGSLRDTVHIE